MQMSFLLQLMAMKTNRHPLGCTFGDALRCMRSGGLSSVFRRLFHKLSSFYYGPLILFLYPLSRFTQAILKPPLIFTATASTSININTEIIFSITSRRDVVPKKVFDQVFYISSTGFVGPITANLSIAGFVSLITANLSVAGFVSLITANPFNAEFVGFITAIPLLDSIVSLLPIRYILDLLVSSLSIR